MLGHQAYEAKPNKTTALPLLLERLALANALVTIHAIGCQTWIAQPILSRVGDCLLAVQYNLSDLHNRIRRLLDNPTSTTHSRFKTHNGDHDRVGQRRSPDVEDDIFNGGKQRYAGEQPPRGERSAINISQSGVEK